MLGNREYFSLNMRILVLLIAALVVSCGESAFFTDNIEDSCRKASSDYHGFQQCFDALDEEQFTRLLEPHVWVSSRDDPRSLADYVRVDLANSERCTSKLAEGSDTTSVLFANAMIAVQKGNYQTAVDIINSIDNQLWKAVAKIEVHLETLNVDRFHDSLRGLTSSNGEYHRFYTLWGTYIFGDLRSVSNYDMEYRKSIPKELLFSMQVVEYLVENRINELTDYMTYLSETDSAAALVALAGARYALFGQANTTAFLEQNTKYANSQGYRLALAHYLMLAENESDNVRGLKKFSDNINKCSSSAMWMRANLHYDLGDFIGLAALNYPVGEDHQNYLYYNLLKAKLEYTFSKSKRLDTYENNMKKMAPNDQQVLWFLHKLAIARSNNDAALKVLQHMLEIDPYNINALFMVAENHRNALSVKEFNHVTDQIQSSHRFVNKEMLRQILEGLGSE